jgi:RHS repeat-associated protein
LAWAFAGPVQAATETRTSAFEYDPVSGQLTKEIVEPDDPALCLVTTYSYDGFGNKTGSTTRNCNGSAGSHPGINSEAAAPAAGSAPVFASRTSNTGYSADGRFATSSTNALGQTETRQFDARFGKVTQLTGPNGLVTEWKYDGFGRKVLEKRADGTGTKWEYLYCAGVNGGSASCPTIAGAAGKYVIVTTPVGAPIDLAAGTTGAANGPYTKVYADALNREIRSETQGFDGSGSAALIYKDTGYNALGRVERVSRPYFSTGTPIWTRFEYDQLGRVTKEIGQDDTGAAIESTTAYNGLSVTVTNPKGQTQTRTNNVAGQLASVIDAATQTVTFTYDPLGNLVRTTDPLGNQTSLTYDRRGRKTAMSDPDMGNWTYTYNALGELISQTDAKSQTTTLVYDLLGRMTQKNEPDLVSRWYYDRDKNNVACGKSVGKLCQAEADNGYNRSHTYDSLGRQNASTNIIDGVTFTTSSTFDAQGRVATQTYPTGFSTKFVYSTLGYLKELRNNTSYAPFWSADSMDAEGHLLTQTYGNNVTTTQTFSAYTGRIRNIQAGAGNMVQNLAYTYDSLGNIDTRQDSRHNLLETFSYDTLNRLVQASVNASATGIVATSFAYDAIGNLVCKSDLSSCSQALPNMVYGAQVTVGGVTRTLPHAVKNVTGAVHSANNPTYTYDANGNMSAGAGNNVAYTSYNRVRQVWHASRDGVEYLYGSEHQRIREYNRAPGQSGAIKDTTIYLHPDMANGLFYERVVVAATNTTTHKHYLTAMGVVIGVVNRVGTANTTTYFHRDHLGSVTTVSNATGSVLERFAYDAWGKRRLPAGNADPADAIRASATDRGFTNHEHVDTLGLVNMNGRFYDPSLGRFMSADPYIQSPTSLASYNRYAYCWNNPVGCTDPTGYFNLFKSVKKAVSSVLKSSAGRIAVSVAAGFYTGQAVSAWLSTTTNVGFNGAIITQTSISTGGVIGAGAAGGFAGMYVGSGGHLRAGFEGAISGGAFGAAGGIGGEGWDFSRVGAHAVAGCVSNSVGGGDCGSGALSAVAAKVTTIATGGDPVGAILAGGVGAVVGGGKFANGALTATYGYLFNHLPHLIGRLQTLYYRAAPYAEQAATVAEALALAVTGTPSPSSVLMPGGNPIGWIEGGADDLVRTVSKTDFDRVVGNLLNQSQEVVKQNFPGRWFKLADDAGEWGLRMSRDSGATLQLMVKDVPFSKLHYRPSLVDQIPK